MAIVSARVFLDGQWHNAVFQSSTGDWAVTIAAPDLTSFHEPGGFYPMQLESTSSTNVRVDKDITDPILGNKLKLVVREETQPYVFIGHPIEGTFIDPDDLYFTFSLRDEHQGSQINISTLAFVLSGITYAYNSPGMSVAPVTNGYDCVFYPPISLSQGAYMVRVSVTDNDGNLSETVSVSFVVDIEPRPLHLITDRTQADREYAEYLESKIDELTLSGLTPSEYQDWFSDLKGRYNISDLKRVENAVAYISDVLNQFGYYNIVDTKSDWTNSDSFSEAEALRYLDNIRAMLRVFNVFSYTPPLPLDMNNLDIDSANAIEHNLVDMHTLIFLAVKDRTFAAEIYTGEDDWF